MRSRRVALPSILVALAAAACTTTLPGAEAIGGSASVSGTVASTGGDAGTIVASIPDASADAPATDGAATMVDDAGADVVTGPPLPSAVCPAVIALGASAVQTFSTAGDDSGLSVTPDQLSAAWVTDTGSTLHWVDRATTADPFGPERTLAGSFGDRVALTSDGLGLAIVNPDGLGFSLYARATRADAFTTSTVGPFASLADMGTNELAPAGEHFAAPLFARGDWFFLYSRVSRTGSVTYVSTRFNTTDPLAGGAPYVEDALGVAGQLRSVTGASTDLRTLFVWDDAAKKSRALTLTAANDLVTDVEVGSMRDLQASGDCQSFWFTSGSPLAIVTSR